MQLHTQQQRKKLSKHLCFVYKEGLYSLFAVGIVAFLWEMKWSGPDGMHSDPF